MGEQKQGKTSQKNLQQRPWFWPVVYSSIALAIIVLIISYNALVDRQENQQLMEEQITPDSTLVETAARQETMKYPFKEEYLDEVQILQDFYDIEADATSRENSLLVFNQVFTTSSGISLSINSEPFEVMATMSGEVAEVKQDEFTGNSITINHADGIQTRYSSLGDVLVKEGDLVGQGEQIATSTENEWNPAAGIHLHFEVLEAGTPINPRKLLAF